jgi:hypothetical protein
MGGEASGEQASAYNAFCSCFPMTGKQNTLTKELKSGELEGACPLHRAVPHFFNKKNGVTRLIINLTNPLPYNNLFVLGA